MNLNCPHQYITDQSALEAALPTMAASSALALDLEFDRDRYAYGFTLCLIQVSDGRNTWILDPMMKIDLQKFYRILENPGIMKIMHAPGEDLSLLHQQGCFPRTIFDTERAARLLNKEQFSLGNLLQQFLGVELDKSQQRTDWTRRPLKEAQRCYAALDVVHLAALREAILAAVQHPDVLQFIGEENKAWDDYRVEEKRAGWFVNKDDERKLPPFQLHVYNALLAVRDKHARRLNKPGYMILSRDTAMDLCFNDALFGQWESLGGLHPSMKQRRMQEEFHIAFNAAYAEAHRLKLSKRGAGASLSQKEREQAAIRRKETADKVERIYRPIQQVIAERYGQFTAAYMLNERVMSELASGRMQLDQMPFPYRARLIKEIAQSLSISLD